MKLFMWVVWGLATWSGASCVFFSDYRPSNVWGVWLLLFSSLWAALIHAPKYQVRVLRWVDNHWEDVMGAGRESGQRAADHRGQGSGSADPGPHQHSGVKP